jgi:hypothetical protein
LPALPELMDFPLWSVYRSGERGRAPRESAGGVFSGVRRAFGGWRKCLGHHGPLYLALVPATFLAAAVLPVAPRRLAALRACFESALREAA